MNKTEYLADLVVISSLADEVEALSEGMDIQGSRHVMILEELQKLIGDSVMSARGLIGIATSKAENSGKDVLHGEEDDLLMECKNTMQALKHQLAIFNGAV